ncbi:ABC transporter substrate-binding protein [Methylobacterium sp. NEAU 140]|uniref:ABC transporter substrate-binding protein n=1 Tax=Methylobacterium sp. NEAU 140 TaxID=3064945 RepID=UPI002732F117|nr:ABC transporter substrate-binding protein [Methylobacterium sp. NEAU 140]MDP4022390.1 ABC transporter substrate-binding protein [Methylobacterium sp. NEAU 140]
MRMLRAAALAGAVLLGGLSALRAEVNEVRITRQPSIVYLPLVVMQEAKLLEKQAEAAGLGPLKVTWTTMNSGGASTDALLAGNIDMVTSGCSNLLLLWDRTKGEVKGVAGASAIPMVLVTRNPAVKTIADFTEKDRIAVPTLKVSMQATALKLAAEKTFGDAGRDKLDPLTVQLGHPDATAAVLSPNHEINSHFSLPPYLNQELADPRVHKVLDSADVVGGPLSNGVVFSTRKFSDANPKTMAAFRAALEEAIQLIKTDPRKASELYLASTKEKFTPEELTAMITAPGVVYSTTPYNTEKVADLFARSGLMKTKPKGWKDYFFPAVHDLPGT